LLAVGWWSLAHSPSLIVVRWWSLANLFHTPNRQ
jgi:hypothetical protein